MTDIFDIYLKTEATKTSYRYCWNRFLKYLNISEEELFSLNGKQQEEKIIPYTNYLKGLKRSPTIIKVRLDVIKFAFSMNDIVLNWVRLKKLVPEKVKPTGVDTWNDSEIREMIKCAGSVRNRALIYFFCSIGCRVSAMTEIKLKDIEYFEDCMCIMIYAGYPEEYPSFLTPEATRMVKHYLKTREERGEILTPKTPLLASEAVIHKREYGDGIAKLMTKQSTTSMFENIFSKFPNSRTKQGFRYNIQVTYGFRKWQATKLKLKIDVKHSISERLVGHKAGLDSNYFVTNSRESKMQLFEALKKCIPDLTLDESEKDRIKIDNLSRKIIPKKLELCLSKLNFKMRNLR